MLPFQSIALGILISTATLPVVVAIVHFSKSYIFSIIISFIYAVINFIITMFLSVNPEVVSSVSSILPIPIIFRWYLSLFPLEETLLFMEPYVLNTPVTFGILVIFGIVTVYLINFIYKRKEI